MLEILRNSRLKTFFWSSLNLRSCLKHCATALKKHIFEAVLIPKAAQQRNCFVENNWVKKITCLNDQAHSCLIHFFYCLLLTACCLLLEILRNSSLKTFFWSSLKLRSCATAQLLLWKQYGPEKRSELKGWVLLTAWNTAQQQSQNIFLKQSESQKLLETLRNSPHKTYFWSSIIPKAMQQRNCFVENNWVKKNYLSKWPSQ